jgi:hypothetical protein
MNLIKTGSRLFQCRLGKGMSAMAVLLRQLIDSVRARVITESSPANGDQQGVGAGSASAALHRERIGSCNQSDQLQDSLPSSVASRHCLACGW